MRRVRYYLERKIPFQEDRDKRDECGERGLRKRGVTSRYSARALDIWMRKEHLTPGREEGSLPTLKKIAHSGPTRQHNLKAGGGRKGKEEKGAPKGGILGR